MIETVRGIEYVVEGREMKLGIDLDQVEAQIKEYVEQGHQVGGYLLGIPVSRTDTESWDKKIRAYEMDMVFALHSDFRTYKEGNPRMAKWYLEQTGEYGLFVQTEEQFRASDPGSSERVFEQDMVRELQRTRSIKTVDGWCLPGEGALERLRLGENENDLTEVDDVTVTAIRGDNVINGYRATLLNRNKPD